MKKIALLLIGLFITACEIEYDEFQYYDYNIVDGEIESYMQAEHTKTEKIEYISSWVLSHIEWTADPPGIDEWQTPLETYEMRCGDCDDQAILFMFFVHKYLGIESILILAECHEGGHYVVRVGDGYYFNVFEDMINYDNPDKWIINLEIGYYYALYMAENIK